MMDFVRSLAPPREGSAGAAVALLRSRIVQPLPISARVPGVLDAVPSLAEGDLDRAVPSTASPDLGVSAERRPSGGEARPPLGPLPARVQVAEAGAAPVPRPSAQDAPVAAARREGVAALPPRSDVASTTRRHGSQETRAMSPSTPPREERPASSSASLHRPRAEAPIAVPARAATPAARAQAPLTATALAARTSAVAAPPTVVHVTIDRIDLRLPASAPARPVQRPRAGSVALADYLGARKAGGNGAPR